MWIASGSDTCNLLMGRVKAATEQKDLDLAIKLLDAVIELKPTYTEAWNRRATIYYLQKDYGHALSDIREVLAREPRHFGALSGSRFHPDRRSATRSTRSKPIAVRSPSILISRTSTKTIKNFREKVEGREI